MSTTTLNCGCGQVRIDVTGAPIASVECCCTTCRAAAVAFEALPGAPTIRTAHDSVPYVMYRKDRVAFESGFDQLAAHRLSPEDGTRRVVATCCNTPVFLEFKGGHWLSVYGLLWPDGTRPALQLRTVTKSAPDRDALPDDVPNPRMHNASFYFWLFRAWVAMGFRSPKIEIERTLEA